MKIHNPLLNQDILNEPYDAISKLRDNSPIFFCDNLNGWVVTSYQDSCALFRNPNVVAGSLAEQVKNQMQGSNINLVKDYIRIRSKMILHQDGKEHRRLRAPSTNIFTKLQVLKLKPIIETALNTTISEVKNKEMWDFATEFAEPFSTRVIAGLFDIPEKDRKAFQQAGDDVSRFFGTTMGDIEKDAKNANDAILYLEKYFKELVKEKLVRPGNDLLSFLLKSKIDSELEIEEIIAQCILIQMAGHYTVIDQLCNSLNIFLRNDQYSYLRNNPHLLAQAIEGSIRLDGGVLFMGRTVKEKFNYHEHTFSPGETLFLALGAANRDPHFFKNPDQFSLNRDNNKHLGFGHAHHKCLGMELGKLELHEAFMALFENFKDLKLANRPATRKAESLFFRGFYNLYVQSTI